MLVRPGTGLATQQPPHVDTAMKSQDRYFDQSSPISDFPDVFHDRVAPVRSPYVIQAWLPVPQIPKHPASDVARK